MSYPFRPAAPEWDGGSTWPLALSEAFSQFPENDEAKPTSSPRAAEASRKVLVVDDERLLADTTSAILRRAGFDTKVAYNGWEALELARSFVPDYLLTDVMMPMMNGLELGIAVAQMLPGTKILLFSGQAGVTNILDEGKARGYEFPLLAKPAHPSKVIESLRALGE